jgi:hypothetical protein
MKKRIICVMHMKNADVMRVEYIIFRYVNVCHSHV